MKQQSIETFPSTDSQVENLKDLFKQHILMYVLPMLSEEDTIKTFQEKYLPSILRFIPSKKSGMEVIQKEVENQMESIKDVVTADVHYLKNIINDQKSTEVKQLIFNHLNDLDEITSPEEKVEIIKIALENESDRNVQVLAYSAWVELSEELSEGEEVEANKILEPALAKIFDYFGDYFLYELTLIVLKSINIISLKSINTIKEHYQKAEDVITKNLLLGCLLAHLPKKKFSENEIKSYLKWREEEYNSNLYYYFHRQSWKSDFGKTGGDIKLFGKTLFNKIIQHTLPTVSLMAWRRVYENPQVWQERGFDYVPIEPIISFRNKDENYSQANSAVLGITLWEYEKIFGENKKLFQEVEKIKQVLRILQVKYNYKIPQHWHKHNFCLQFERDKNGEIDLNKRPRIYLIDWDYGVII